MKAHELENLPNLKVYDETLTYSEEVKLSYLGLLAQSQQAHPVCQSAST